MLLELELELELERLALERSPELRMSGRGGTGNRPDSLAPCVGVMSSVGGGGTGTRAAGSGHAGGGTAGGGAGGGAGTGWSLLLAVSLVDVPPRM